MAFSVMVEMLNLKIRGREAKPVELHNVLREDRRRNIDKG